MNRLGAVQRGDAVLGYAFYDEELHPDSYVQTKAQARETLAQISRSLFIGSDTNTSDAIRQAMRRIELMAARLGAVRPELVVVTDGDDFINVTLDELEGVVLHAFVLERESPELRRLAEESGGICLEEL